MSYLLEQNFDDLKGRQFQIFSAHNSHQDKYYQIKASKIQIENQSSIMLKIIDITVEVMLNKQKTHNKLLSVINSTVSHEIRNPLNSIVAINHEKKYLYQALQNLFSQSISQKQMINNSKEILKQLFYGIKV